jgi:BNR repeat-like domain
MRIRPVALVTLPFLACLLWAAPPTATAAAGQRHGGGWTPEQRWSPKNDWEPNIAADPSSSWLYQMTTQYGGPAVCRPRMGHCILFRSSPDRGKTWHKSIVMSRWKCSPGKACSRATWQNDPVLTVSTSGVIYAAWMNNWDVVFARSPDHGKTWTGFHDFRRALRGSFTDKPWIAISPGGRDVYVAFNESDSYVSASHDYGRSWSAPVKTNTGGRYWFAEGGAVAPDGHVYFAESAEHQNAKGTVRLAVISSADGGGSWMTTYVARSQQQPPCPVADCPNDFYGPQISLAIDRAGTILAAYVANTAPQAPMRLYMITSADGRTWSAPAGLGAGGTKVGADFPAVAAGRRAGQFRVAWEDDRNGAQAWNVWTRATADQGTSWSPAVRVSDRGSGAPYKTSAGFRFPYGDFFGITVDSHGISYLAWSEGNSYDGPGSTWWSRDHGRP